MVVDDLDRARGVAAAHFRPELDEPVVDLRGKEEDPHPFETGVDWLPRRDLCDLRDDLAPFGVENPDVIR